MFRDEMTKHSLPTRKCQQVFLIIFILIKRLNHPIPTCLLNKKQYEKYEKALGYKFIIIIFCFLGQNNLYIVTLEYKKVDLPPFNLLNNVVF
jgi:hypothetical protein